MCKCHGSDDDFWPVELIQKFRSPFRRFFSLGELLFVLAFVLFTFLTGLLSASLPSIGGSSEAREAHIIRLMVERGDYVLPLRNGIVPSKPPLFHWIGALTSKLIGELSPFTARIPSLLAAASMLFLVALCAAQLSRSRTHCEREKMILCALGILATSYLFEKMRTVAMVDALFAAMITAAVTVIVLRIGDEKAVRLSSLDYTLFYFFSGLAVLAKGPAGIVLSLIFLSSILAGVYGFKAALRELLTPRIGWLVFLIVAVPWYVFSASRQSHAFLGKQILFENIRRVVGGEHITERPWWFYLPAFVREIFPWSILFLLAARSAFCRASGDQGRKSALVRSLYRAVAIIIVVFSIARGKRESYLLPLLPWVSVLVALYLTDWWGRARDAQRRRVKLLANGLVIFLLLALSITLVGVELSEKVSFDFLSPLAAIVAHQLKRDLFTASIVVAAVGGLGFWGNRLARYSAWICVCSLPALLSIAIALGFSVRNQLKDFEGVSAQVQTHVGNAPLQVAREMRDEFFDGVLYYLGREVELIEPSEFIGRCSGFALLRYEHWQKWQGDLPGATLIAEYNEIDDRLRGKVGNKKVLIRCSPSRAAELTLDRVAPMRRTEGVRG